MGGDPVDTAGWGSILIGVLPDRAGAAVGSFRAAPYRERASRVPGGAFLRAE